jgi:hypothetical protein
MVMLNRFSVPAPFAPTNRSADWAKTAVVRRRGRRERSRRFIGPRTRVEAF